MAAEYFSIGSSVAITTCHNIEYRGEVLAFDWTSKVLAISILFYVTFIILFLKKCERIRHGDCVQFSITMVTLDHLSRRVFDPRSYMFIYLKTFVITSVTCEFFIRILFILLLYVDLWLISVTEMSCLSLDVKQHNMCLYFFNL